MTVLKGNVGQDPEIRYTQTSNTKVATYSLAVYRANPKDKDKPLTDWFNIVAWGDQADLVENNVHKGDKLILTGKFQTRSYDNKEGKKVTVTEFYQDDMGMVPKKEESGSFVYSNEELPF